MISKASSSDFPTETGRKAAGSDWNPSENDQIWKHEYDVRIQRPIMLGSDRFSLATAKIEHQILASYSYFHVPVIFRVLRSESARTLEAEYFCHKYLSNRYMDTIISII